MTFRLGESFATPLLNVSAQCLHQTLGPMHEDFIIFILGSSATLSDGSEWCIVDGQWLGVGLPSVRML